MYLNLQNVQRRFGCAIILFPEREVDHDDIGFRSDTVTRPTPKCGRRMAEAEVGDDVIGFDPTIRSSKPWPPRRWAKEAGLFCPSGTMGNSIAVKAWTNELQEVVVEGRSTSSTSSPPT
jgi:threonine aldolase